MPFLPLRKLPPTPNASLSDAWLERIADRLAKPGADPVKAVTELLDPANAQAVIK